MLLIKVKCCFILLAKKSFSVRLYFTVYVEETLRPDFGDVKENVIPLFVFLTLYYLLLRCSLPGGPSWTSPRSSRRARLPLGGEVRPFPLSAILRYTGSTYPLHSPGFSAPCEDSRFFPIRSVRASRYFGTAAGHRRSAVSPANTVAGCSSGPVSTYTPP